MRRWRRGLPPCRRPQAKRKYPQIIDFETFIDTEQIEEVGLQHRDGKLRIVLGASIQLLAAPAHDRNGTAAIAAVARLSRSHIRFWVVHPGGRKVIDNVPKHFGITDTQLRFSRKRIAELRKYVVSHSHACLGRGCSYWRSATGDSGVMVALGPGTAADVALPR